MSLLPGDFLKFIISWTEAIGPLHHLLRKRQPDARMSDVELAIRFLAFKNQQTQYAGDLKQFLDDFCKKKNGQFASDLLQENQCTALLSEMNEAINVGLSEFGERNFCRKYSNGSYESRFNRAVFDVLVGSMSSHELRSWVSLNQGAIERLYRDVCTQNADFIRSVESTTKSPEATRTRFGIWYGAINSVAGIRLQMPDIK
jgi:hypothetical protein